MRGPQSQLHKDREANINSWRDNINSSVECAVSQTRVTVQHSADIATQDSVWTQLALWNLALFYAAVSINFTLPVGKWLVFICTAGWQISASIISSTSCHTFTALLHSLPCEPFYMSLSVILCLSLFISACVCLSVCLDVSLSVCLAVCLHVSVFICLWYLFISKNKMLVWWHRCLSVCLHYLCLSVSLYVSMYLCRSVSLYVSMYLCLSVCIGPGWQASVHWHFRQPGLCHQTVRCRHPQTPDHPPRPWPSPGGRRACAGGRDRGKTAVREFPCVPGKPSSRERACVGRDTRAAWWRDVLQRRWQITATSLRSHCQPRRRTG